jgi:chromosome segregation ATPase
MWVFFTLLCYCQTLLASHLDESPTIQALEERMTLLELNNGKHLPGETHINGPTSNLPDGNDVRSETYQNLKSKIRNLEENLLGHEEMIIQLRNSKDRIDTLEKSFQELLMTVTQQKKEMNRVRGLEAKVVKQGRTIAFLRKQTLEFKRTIFNFHNQLNLFQNNAKASYKAFDPLEKSAEDEENAKQEELISIRGIYPENRGLSPQSKFITALQLFVHHLVTN